MTNRRANAVMFGFDFQVNAAIVLMLDNMKELQAVKIESDNEDIELFLNNNECILAQAKAVQHSSYDFNNVRANLNKALKTLSEACSKTNVKKAIFITNSPNPFRDDDSRPAFYGHARRSFANIPPSAQKIITDNLHNIDMPLDTDKFVVHVLPFETDDEQERYKEIKRCIDDFIGDLGIMDCPGLGKKLMSVWQNSLFGDGTKANPTIKLKKTDIVWPIIVFVTEVSNGMDFLDGLDLGLKEETIRQYSQLIDSMCERMEFFSRILYDYNDFKCNTNNADKCKKFIEQSWTNYLPYLDSTDLNSEVKETLIKLVLYNVIRRRFYIDNIKNGVGL